MDGYESGFEMRVYLDTNIVIYFLYNRDELSSDVSGILFDYSNILLISSVCVHEMIHLAQIGKVQKLEKGRKVLINPETIIDNIYEAGINIVKVEENHLSTLASLSMYEDHRDPNDRLIIAQAIADRIPLVSSDHKFARYERYGLDFIFNER